MKISVCLATYNGEKFIKDQLDSILCQLSENDEIIISDDESTDETRNIILSYADPRIKLLIHKSTKTYKNQIASYQVTTNFENALRNATGDIIFLSDQDDIWGKTKVHELLALFKVQNINLILHDATVINEQYQIIADSYFKSIQSKPGFLKNILKNSYLGCCMAFDKSVLKCSLPFPENLIAHDMWIGLIAERIGRVAFIERKLIDYQRHELTVTTTGSRSKHSFLFKLKFRFQFIFQYLTRAVYLKLI